VVAGSAAVAAHPDLDFAFDVAPFLGDAEFGQQFVECRGVLRGDSCRP
jgi:hypothetical protein